MKKFDEYLEEAGEAADDFMYDHPGATLAIGIVSSIAICISVTYVTIKCGSRCLARELKKAGL